SPLYARPRTRFAASWVPRWMRLLLGTPFSARMSNRSISPRITRTSSRQTRCTQPSTLSQSHSLAIRSVVRLEDPAPCNSSACNAGRGLDRQGQGEGPEEPTRDGSKDHATGRRTESPAFGPPQKAGLPGQGCSRARIAGPDDFGVGGSPYGSGSLIWT